MKQYTRECVLCDRMIPDKYVACSKHIKEYMRDKDTPWMKDMLSMNLRQSIVNKTESLFVYENVIHTPAIGGRTDLRSGTGNTYRNKLILAEYSVGNSKQIDIAKKFGLTARGVRKVIQREEIRKRGT